MNKLFLKLKTQLNQQSIRAFIKFCMVGAGSTLLSYTVFYVLYSKCAVYYLLSSVIGYVSGLIFGYFLNKLWTFNVKKNSILLAVKYVLIYMVSLGLSMLLLYVLVEYAKINPLLSNVFVIMVSTFTNFFGVKLFVFKK
tara:strand:- start:714 stop:1130 length:417 start_codon:yes stop_codon:yes gene_type:complete